jgi:YaaC-like Protein
MIIRAANLVSEADIGRYGWSNLRRFQNVRFVNELLTSRQDATASNENLKKQAQQIRYCLQQAEEYFAAAGAVSLATKPPLMYYSIMNLALAEIRFKQSGESSLDKARDQHRHHGMQPTVGSFPRAETRLEVVSAALRAKPMLRQGQRFGTFELWTRSARHWPVVGIEAPRNLRWCARLPSFQRVPHGPWPHAAFCGARRVCRCRSSNRESGFVIAMPISSRVSNRQRTHPAPWCAPSNRVHRGAHQGGHRMREHQQACRRWPRTKRGTGARTSQEAKRPVP